MDDDPFKPYSPETKGDLITYLKKHYGGIADNFFLGPQYFFEIKDLGLLIPTFSSVRVGNGPSPDISYVVNENLMLESFGHGHSNMSIMGAAKGIYDPAEALKDKYWSIKHLKLWKL